MPPKAKAKGVAAKAKAKAAFAGKAKAQSAGLGKGGGALPQGTLRPSGPAPVATRRWVHCGTQQRAESNGEDKTEGQPRA